MILVYRISSLVFIISALLLVLWAIYIYESSEKEMERGLIRLIDVIEDNRADRDVVQISYDALCDANKQRKKIAMFIFCCSLLFVLASVIFNTL